MPWFRRKTLIDRLAKECRYLVVEREGEHYRLRPENGSVNRYVNVRQWEGVELVSFWVVFPVSFPLSAVSSELPLGLLQRNRKLSFGQWCMEVAGSCELVPYLHYMATRAGLTASVFKTICQEMLIERSAVHDLLRAQVADMTRGRPEPAAASLRSGGIGNGLAAFRDFPPR